MWDHNQLYGDNVTVTLSTFLNCHSNKILTQWDYSYKSQCVKEKRTIICTVKTFSCFQKLHFIIIVMIFMVQLEMYFIFISVN